MSIEGRQLGDRGVEFQRMPTAAPEPQPRLVDARLVISLVMFFVGVLGATIGGLLLWGLGGALIVGGVPMAAVGLWLGLDK